MPKALADVLSKWLPSHKAPTQTKNIKTLHNNPGGEKGAQQLSIFDMDGMLTRMLDDESMARDILTVFLQDTPRSIVLLKEVLRSSDTADLERICHTIKGAAENVGGLSLGAIAREMENNAKTGSVDLVRDQVEVLEKEFALLKIEITKKFDLVLN